LKWVLKYEENLKEKIDHVNTPYMNNTPYEHCTLREHERKSILNLSINQNFNKILIKYKDLLRRHIYWSKKKSLCKKKIFDENKQEQIMSFL